MATALLIEGAAEIATLAGGPRRGAAQADAAVLRDAAAGLAIASVDGTILAVGGRAEVLRALEGAGVDARAVERVDARGGLITPGLVDPHTHLLFGGSRERERELRQSGAGYLEILAAGGGILSTVDATRLASVDDLLAHGRRWLDEMLAHGVTTLEAKSGYGLDAETELKLLAAAGQLGAEGPIEIVPTFLGAHAVPRAYRDRTDGVDAYVDEVIERQLPRVAEQGVARFCDVFCEIGVFDAAQSRRVLAAGAALGMRARLHADELQDTDGAALAAELGAASADHLGAIGDAGIEALGRAADAGTPVVATLLPATTLTLGHAHHAPARRLIERGVPVAIGTDFNPGTSPTPNMQLILALGTTLLGLTPTEALVAATANAALAVGLDASHGTLEPGRQADLVVWDVPTLDQLPYWLGADLTRAVVKRGRVVYRGEGAG